MGTVLNRPIANTLLCSCGALHLVGARHNEEKSSLFPAPLTEELRMITSILRNWADVDASFSALPVSAVGLVEYLSNAGTDNTWIDECRCVIATVTNGKNVTNGLQFAGQHCPVNRWEDNNHCSFVNYDFALVATVAICETHAGVKSIPLIGAKRAGRTVHFWLSHSHGRSWGCSTQTNTPAFGS
ncbi:trans-sialidase, putative [Trypanosoma cruzi]|nr:trans-sialidase, putative [Trypanosoma cruzi]